MPRLIIEARESGTSTGRYIDKLLEYLCQQRPDFEVVVLTKKPRVDFIRTIAPGFSVVESNFKEFSFGEQLGLARQLYGLKANLVHFSMTQQPVLYFGKSLTTVHDLTTTRFRNPAKNWLVFKLKQWVYRGLIVWAAHKSRALLTVSDFVKNDLARFAHVSQSKITTTYLAADKISDLPEPVTGLKNVKFIMYVGRPLPHKNLKRLIDAFAIVRKNQPEVKLVCAGKKDILYERLEGYAAKKGLADSVVFCGFVSEGQLRWLYENTAAYIFPSLSEGFGLPGLEAMAHGAPVVSSNATCLPEIYGEAALYFNPKDTLDMATKISQILTNPDLVKKLITKGHAQVAKYSWRKMATQTLAIYKKVLDA